MGITTKTGDRGKTSLLGGRRVPKDHVVIKACSHLDELSSFLGLVRCLVRNSACKKLLESIQKDLYIICSEASAGQTAVKKLTQRIDGPRIKKLEDRILELESRPGVNKCFTLAGEDLASGFLDVARARCRSAEILIVTLKNRKLLPKGSILIYLNRLSDLLYLMSRSRRKL